MKITKLENGKYKVDGRPHGANGKRITRVFDLRRDAVAFEQWLKSQAEQNKEWTPRKSDRRTLKELVSRWYDLHGKTLKAGEKRVAIVNLAGEKLNKPAQKLTSTDYLAYRNERLNAGTHPKTLNNELGYINAVYNELYHLDEIKFDNPLKRVKMLKIDERELAWLTDDEIPRLLNEMENGVNPHVRLISEICLNTGARWSEAEGLTNTQVRNQMVTFAGTKSGKTRSIPISAELETRLRAHFAMHTRFESSLQAFRHALKRSGIMLPKGQASHVLRHSFAAHFIMNGGNILTLQKILGHSTITMTMRYAHLAPEHLQDAVKLNPMQTVKKYGKKVESH